MQPQLKLQRKTKMKKPSEVFKNIRFAKLDPKHDKGPKGSTDDEEHGAVSEIEWDQQLKHVKKRAMQEKVDKPTGELKDACWKGYTAVGMKMKDGKKVPNCVPTNEGTDMKSARIIKSLYNKKGVVKEELYDAEKEDKSVTTYGKKPKHDKADKEDSHGENKPKAAAVLSGGKTLTGEPRDTIEIDPLMRVRPGQPDPTKDKDKDKDKKKDNKKDK